MSFIYLALGSNLGNRVANLHSAIDHLKKYFVELRHSIILDNQAVLPEHSPKEFDLPYLNAIVYGRLKDANTQPLEFFDIVKSIEYGMGRPRDYGKNSPRVIDIDILLWEGVVLDTVKLSIPHHGLSHRTFILHLLGLIDPNLVVTFPDNTAYSIQDMLLSHRNEIAQCFTKVLALYPVVFGILNLSSNSFSDGGKYTNVDKAVEHIDQMLGEGATMIDIGAIATNPRVGEIISQAEEMSILMPLLKILESRIQKDLHVSIDTVYKQTVMELLEKYQISWINDSSGSLDEECMRYVASRNCGIISLHCLSIPANDKIIMSSEQNVVEEIIDWMKEQGRFLKKCGFEDEKIVLDPGIGFGKTMHQNWLILRNIKKISAVIREELGFKVMIGHSRKGFLSAVTHKLAIERDLETAQVSGVIRGHVDYLRVHDVETTMSELVTSTLLDFDGYSHLS